MSVKGDSTAALLKNLQPGTQYDISVSARYPSGLGDPLEGQGTTLEGKPVIHTIHCVLVARHQKNIKKAIDGQPPHIHGFKDVG